MRYEMVSLRGYYDKINLWYYYECFNEFSYIHEVILNPRVFILNPTVYIKPVVIPITKIR